MLGHDLGPQLLSGNLEQSARREGTEKAHTETATVRTGKTLPAGHVPRKRLRWKTAAKMSPACNFSRVADNAACRKCAALDGSGRVCRGGYSTRSQPGSRRKEGRGSVALACERTA